MARQLARAESVGSDGSWQPPRLNSKTLFVLGAMNMIDCININLLNPYVDEMVSDLLGKSPDEPEVAQTVGLLIGLYSLCEVLFSVLWGTIADRIGRKPALLIGLGGSVIAPIMFGLGKSLPMIFTARALDGFFCGNIGVTRTYLGEIVDETNEAKGFSFLAVNFSLGLFIGPMLGGELVYPARWAPGLFAGTIFETYPYLLPNLTYAIFALVAWIIGAIFLEETLPRSKRCKWGRRAAEDLLNDQGPGLQRQHSMTPGTDPIGAPAGFCLDEAEDARILQVEGESTERSSKWCCLYPRTLFQVLMAYCTLSGFTAAGNQLFILLVCLPRSADGWALKPSEIGILQNIGAAALLLTQTCFYPRWTKRFGFYKVFCCGWILMLSSYLLFPVYGLFADPSIYGFWRFVPLGCMQFVLATAGGMVFPTAFAFINRAAAGMDRGAVNGWSNSTGALCRASFPPFSAWLLTMGMKTGHPWGRYLPIYLNGFVSCVALIFALPGLRKIDKQGASVPIQPKPRRTSAAADRASGGAELTPGGSRRRVENEEQRSRREPLVGSAV
eukprot:TRINITY_DN8377_c0_g3_i1.p1 TRINITY_DN8377_c0_g3~~TRINITY_DN8377_c0_g3_i1.p1  ORF type:complete len:568 (-),score=62.44 TRINITY_DN8377_c0_g3_i1:178-1848(-)